MNKLKTHISYREIILTYKLFYTFAREILIIIKC